MHHNLQRHREGQRPDTYRLGGTTLAGTHNPNENSILPITHLK